MFPKQDPLCPAPSLCVEGSGQVGRTRMTVVSGCFENGEKREATYVGDAVTSLGISLEGLCSFWLTKLEPQQSLSCEK